MSVGFRSGLTRWRYPEPSFRISPHSAHCESGSPFVVARLLPAVSRLQASSAGSPAGTLLLKELFPEPPLVSVESVTEVGVILTQEPCLRNAWHTQVFPDPELGREMRTSPPPPKKISGKGRCWAGNCKSHYSSYNLPIPHYILRCAVFLPESRKLSFLK